MKTTLQERARILVDELELRGVTQVDIAKAADVSKGTVNQWLTGGIKSMKLEYGLGIERAYGYNHKWLVMGEAPKQAGEARETGADQPFDANTIPASVGTRRIPLLNYVQAGVFTDMGTNFPAEDMEYLLTDLPLSSRSFALEIKGLSMKAPPGTSDISFNEGDKIVVDCEKFPRPGDFVVAKNSTEEATFKKYKLIKVDDQGHEVFELVPLNPDYPTVRSDEHRLTVIGVMVEHRKYFR